MTHTTDQERAEPIKMQTGDDLHLTMLMAPHGLNFVTGKDREHLLALGRDVWQASRRAQVVPHTKVKPDFRWDSESKHHIPTLLIEFDPVPAGEPCDAKGWTDRDNLAAMLAAAPQPPEAACNPSMQPELATEAAAEHKALRSVYEAARGLLRYEGVDDGRAITYRSKLASAIEEVKHIDSGLWEHPESNSAEFDRIKAAPVPKFNHAAKRKLELLQGMGQP